MVTNPDGVEVPVVQANQYGKYLGKLTVTWDDNGVVTAAAGEPMLLDKAVVPDEDFLAQVAELGGPIQEVDGRRHRHGDRSRSKAAARSAAPRNAPWAT